jgi:hypothetical protein
MHPMSGPADRRSFAARAPHDILVERLSRFALIAMHVRLPTNTEALPFDGIGHHGAQNALQAILNVE